MNQLCWKDLSLAVFTYLILFYFLFMFFIIIFYNELLYVFSLNYLLISHSCWTFCICFRERAVAYIVRTCSSTTLFLLSIVQQQYNIQ